MEATETQVEEVQNQEAVQNTEAQVNSTTTATETVDTAIETKVAPQQTVSFEDGLKEFGFSKEDLLELKAKREAEKAELEKPLQEQNNWADQVKFGIEQKLITKEDLEKHTINSKKSDRDLVFENFVFDNADGLEGSELEEAKLEAFEEEYNLSVSNEKAKAKASILLKQEADKIREEVSSKIGAVNSRYSEQQIATKFKQDQSTILKELQGKGFTETIEIEGTKIDVNIPITMTAEEAQASLLSPEGVPILELMHDLYKKNPEGAQHLYREFLVNSNKQQAIANSAYQAGLEAGKALNFGATAPFIEKEQVQKQSEQVQTSEEQRQAKRRAAGIPDNY